MRRPRLDRAILAGAALSASFVAAVSFADAVGPALFIDPDPRWVWPRCALGLALAAIAAGAAAVARGALELLRRAAAIVEPPPALDLPPAVLAAVAAMALLAGAALRLRAVEQIPFPLFHDELLLLPPAMELQGRPADFRDAIRTVLDDSGRSSGSVGVLYLEGMRGATRIFGTTVLGIRLLSLAGGIVSLATGTLLGMALLPAGGGTLVAVILAGLRWHLILSRWGWNMIVLVPFIDAATILALRARRGSRRGPAIAAGVVAGLGAHVYLSAWIAGASLALFVAWPAPGRRIRPAAALTVALGFALAAAPLFLLRSGRRAPYLVRASNHNVFVEMRLTRSILPIAHAARDALIAPWLPDPIPRNDVPGRPRLPLLVGIGLAAAIVRSLLRPRDDLPALMLSQAGFAFATCLVWGETLMANGSRFGYLTSLTAVASASGLLGLAAAVPAAARRPAAWILVGALAISGAPSIGQLERWDRLHEVYVDFCGQYTTVGRAAARWEAYGPVVVEESHLYAPLPIDVIQRYRILPRAEVPRDAPPGPRGPRRFRICPPETKPTDGERVVERVRDAWGRDWAVVLARRDGAPRGVTAPVSGR
ncbi:MAG TPA: hypothetical protein VIA45_14700 [Thermoanaerobaculia bacterium]